MGASRGNEVRHPKIDALIVVNCVNRAGVVALASIELVIVDCWNLIELIPFVMVTHVSRN